MRFWLIARHLNAWFNILVDDFTIGTLTPTIVNRRGFVRTFQLSLSSTMPNDGIAASQIGRSGWTSIAPPRSKAR